MQNDKAENWKEQERSYYDSKARAAMGHRDLTLNGSEGHPGFLREPYIFLDRKLKEIAPGKKALDFGCGDGIHSIPLAQFGATVTGIDISPISLDLAQKRRELAGISEKALQFELGDCTALRFKDSEFDCVLCVGTLSSIPLTRGLDEVKRVLKPDGVFIGMDTLKYNPFAVLSRTFKYLRGKRTANTLKGVFSTGSLDELRTRFKSVEFNYFQLFSLVGMAFPQNLPLQEMLTRLDRRLFETAPIFKPLAFKVIYICRGPIKD
jgi:ubiquinone/menaquinone biosynthesis C-methylase UbiE